jgi:hypothetical protein
VGCSPVIAEKVFEAISMHVPVTMADGTVVPCASVSEYPECHLHVVPGRLNRFRLRGAQVPRAIAALTRCTQLSALEARKPTMAVQILQSTAPQETAEQDTLQTDIGEFLVAALGTKHVANHWAPGEVFCMNIRDPRVFEPQHFAASLKTQQASGARQAQSAPAVAVAVAGMLPPASHRRALVRPKDRKSSKSSSAMGNSGEDMSKTSPLLRYAGTEFEFECLRDNEINQAKCAKRLDSWEAHFSTKPIVPTTVTTALGAGASSKDGPSPSHCPLVLIRKEAPIRYFKTQRRSMSGVDIVVPAAWGQTIFRYLQLRGGALAVGEDEFNHLQAKSGLPVFPRDFPDTLAGREFWAAQFRDHAEVNAKRPPQKRTSCSAKAAAYLGVKYGDVDGLSDVKIRNHAVDFFGGSIAAPVTVNREPTNGNDKVKAEKDGVLDPLMVVRGGTHLVDFLPPVYDSKAVAAGKKIDAIAELPELPPRMSLQVLLIPLARGLVSTLAEIVCPTLEDVQAFVAHKVSMQQRREALRTRKTLSSQRKTATSAAVAATVESSLADPLDHGEWQGVSIPGTRSGKGPDRARATSKDRGEGEGEVEGQGTQDDSEDAEKDEEGEEGEEDEEDQDENDGNHNHSTNSASEEDYSTILGRQIIGTVTTGQQPHLNNTHFAVGLSNANMLHEVFRRSYGQFSHPQAHLLVLFRNPRSSWLRPAIVQII